jgi:hypothetical protein
MKLLIYSVGTLTFAALVGFLYILVRAVRPWPTVGRQGIGEPLRASWVPVPGTLEGDPR